MKEKFKQWIYRMIEFRYYVKYRKKIPKGIRRAIIEETIALGQLTIAYKKNKLDDVKEINNVFNIAIKKNNYINEYIDFLKEQRK